MDYQSEIRNLILTIGAYERLMFLDTESTNSLQIEGLPNGKVSIIAQRGGEEGQPLVFMRHQLPAFMQAFNVLDFTGLKRNYFKIDSAGNARNQDEPETRSLVTPDGLPASSESALQPRVIRTLYQLVLQSDLEKVRLDQIPHLTYGPFQIELVIREDLGYVGFRTWLRPMHKAHENAFEAFDWLLDYVRPLVHVEPDDFHLRKSGFSIRANVPAVPFVGQHLADAFLQITQTIDHWMRMRGKEIE